VFYVEKKYIDRFFERITKLKEDGCWLWNGMLDKHKYGIMTTRINNIPKNIFAHRISYFIYFGEFDEKLCVLHKCDNPSCVNPNHLFLGTQLDNIADCVSKGRASGGSSKGSANKAAKLSENDVVEILKLCDEGGTTFKEMAEMYGVSPRTIEGIAYHLSWNILTEGLEPFHYKRISKSDEHKIKELYKNKKYNKKQLMSMFNVGRVTLDTILENKYRTEE
jgi:hypothetical protein